MSDVRKVDSIFDAAIEIESEQRRASFLDDVCRGDEVLRRKVDQLLDAHAQAGSFMADTDHHWDPGYEERFRGAFQATQAMAASGHVGDTAISSASQPATEEGVLGDFRLIREIGRGGMGIVYEAEQISLDRKTALKILPFASVLDKRQLERFKHEARAAATLEHPHIVPVYSVGAARGVHYYAMRFIEGKTVAEVIADWKEGPVPVDATTVEPAGYPTNGPDAANERSPSEPNMAAEVPCDLQTHPSSGRRLEQNEDFVGPAGIWSTKAGRDEAARFRNAASFGIQAAEALQYAHEQGVVHRDVKPSNLLVDFEGTLWVADFGLARVEGEKSATRTGDLIGTLRYMSPEQVLAKRVVVDHRTDVYSLGATLYELLTLQPMHAAEDPPELVHQITFEEPVPPRRIDRQIPRDLETIVLKAAGKRPEERYQTAGELADDLRRYLEDQPILARSPSFALRASKWGRRNRRLVFSVLTSLLVGVACFIGLLWYQVSQARTAAATQAALRRTAESNLYRTEILLAHEEWKEGNVANVLALLEHHIPGPGEPDMRGWEWYYLKSLCHKDLATLVGHRGSVNWIAWSPDGERLATAGSDMTVRVWDVAARKEIHTLSGHAGIVKWVAWSPDGTRLYSQGDGEPVRIWDPNTAKPLGFLGNLPARAAASSPDGSRIVSVHAEQQVIIWNASDGRELNRWKSELCAGPVALTRDFVVSGERWPGRIKVFDTSTGDAQHDINLLLHGILCAVFSPEGSRCATGSKEGSIIVWDPKECSEVLRIEPRDGAITRIAWRHDGRQVVTASDNGRIRLWDANNGCEIATLRGHTARVKCVDWNRVNSLVATGDSDGVVKLWNTEKPQEYIRLGGRTFGVWDVKGALLATGGEELGSIDIRSPQKDGRIDIYDTATWNPVVTIRERFFGGTSSADWSPHGCRLAFAGRGGRVKVWEIPAKTELFSVNAHSPDTRGVAWSPNGQWLATVGTDKLVNVWNIADRKLVVSLRGHTDNLGSVAWSPSGQLLASYSWNGEVKIWDTHTWHQLRELRPGGSESEADGERVIAWSPFGDRLAAGTPEGWFIIWDVKSGREIMSVYAHFSTIECLSWSPDGRRIASGGDDRTVKIWNAQNGTRLLTLRGHEWTIRGLRWSPDGRQLSSGSRDGIRIWGPGKEEVQP